MPRLLSGANRQLGDPDQLLCSAKAHSQCRCSNESSSIDSDCIRSLQEHQEQGTDSHKERIVAHSVSDNKLTSISHAGVDLVRATSLKCTRGSSHCRGSPHPGNLSKSKLSHHR